MTMTAADKEAMRHIPDGWFSAPAKQVLDVCCGSRMMWFDKRNTGVCFGDRRSETLTVTDRSQQTLLPARDQARILEASPTRPPCSLTFTTERASSCVLRGNTGAKGRMVVDNWASFFFTANSAWGLVDSPDVWAAIRALWNRAHGAQNSDGIYLSKSLDTKLLRPNDTPEFGVRAEHSGTTTLGEFFDANGMDRHIGGSASGPG
ncbi:MAG: hypothetical protein JNM98_18630 [Rhodocyclaceae bacterium]|nr:hypothetical protein [Rhodocyclaceae bacterium]